MKIGPLEIRRQVRSDPTLAFQDWVDMHFNYGGNIYPLGGMQTLRGSEEPIARNFSGLVSGAYGANGIVYACVAVRMLLFSEARFQFRQLRDGRPGDLFGTKALAKLEQPWPGGTTGDLLARMEQDNSLAGNFFGLSGIGITRLRPDWVDIALGSQMEHANWDPKAKVIGYVYTPGGRGSGEDPIVYLPEEIVHYAPFPDPMARFRGLSWIDSIIEEVRADKSATKHKLNYFDAGGTPNVLVEFDKEVVKTVADFDKWVEAIRGQLGNMADQHRALFLAGGTKGTVVGSNLEQIQFKETQGAGETRIAAAAGVPPVIAGFSEGLQGSSLNAGNYAASMRRFVDLTMRPLWRNAAGSLARAITVPGGSELWYDDRDIPALREGEKDATEIVQMNSVTIGGLVKDGFTPESSIKAVLAGDLDLLEHTGKISVQLHSPDEEPKLNGQPPPELVPQP